MSIERAWEQSEDANNMWSKAANIIRGRAALRAKTGHDRRPESHKYVDRGLDR